MLTIPRRIVPERIGKLFAVSSISLPSPSPWSPVFLVLLTVFSLLTSQRTQDWRDQLLSLRAFQIERNRYSIERLSSPVGTSSPRGEAVMPRRWNKEKILEIYRAIWAKGEEIEMGMHSSRRTDKENGEKGVVRKERHFEIEQESARGYSGSTRWKSGCFTDTTGVPEFVVRGTMWRLEGKKSEGR